MMAQGNMVLVPESETMRSFMGGLPVFFFGEPMIFVGCGTQRWKMLPEQGYAPLGLLPSRLELTLC